MNDFNKFLDVQLRRMLDPVVATPAPPRGSRRRRARQILALEATIELVPQAMRVVEPVAVTVPVASSQL